MSPIFSPDHDHVAHVAIYLVVTSTLLRYQSALKVQKEALDIIKEIQEDYRSKFVCVQFLVICLSLIFMGEWFAIDISSFVLHAKRTSIW